jgi:proliferating cell nuclear antigen
MASSNILEIRTVQSSAFKILIESLKELLTDTSIDFDETGMKIVSMDNSHVVLVHLKLDANKFECYQCNSKITIGVNMLNLYKLIRTINSNDTLSLFIEENDKNHLGIKIENSEKNTKTTFKLNLLDLDNPKICIDPADFNSVITIPSMDFQKICRDMDNIAEFVEMKNVGSQLILSCKGDFCSQETVLADSDSYNCVNTVTGAKTKSAASAEEIVQGVFNLKYLVKFTKCTNLCNTVELYLKNDYPLVVQYLVASLGVVKLAVAPTINEN